MSSFFVYVAVPEKYFTPSSLNSFHGTSFSNMTAASGAPRFGGKLSIQPPSTSIACGTEATLADIDLPDADLSVYVPGSHTSRDLADLSSAEGWPLMIELCGSSSVSPSRIVTVSAGFPSSV